MSAKNGIDWGVNTETQLHIYSRHQKTDYLKIKLMQGKAGGGGWIHATN